MQRCLLLYVGCALALWSCEVNEEDDDWYLQDTVDQDSSCTCPLSAQVDTATVQVNDGESVENYALAVGTLDAWVSFDVGAEVHLKTLAAAQLPLEFRISDYQFLSAVVGTYSLDATEFAYSNESSTTACASLKGPMQLTVRESVGELSERNTRMSSDFLRRLRFSFTASDDSTVCGEGLTPLDVAISVEMSFGPCDCALDVD